MLAAALGKGKVTDKVGWSPRVFLPKQNEDVTPKVQAVGNQFFSPSPRFRKEDVDFSMFSFPRSESSRSTVETQEANAFNGAGRNLLEEKKYQEAMVFFDASLKALEDGGQNTKTFAVACSGKAACYEGQGNLLESIEWFSKALPIYERSSSWNPALIEERIGTLYERLGEATSALEHFEKAEATPDLHMKIALLYDELKNPTKALEHLLKSQNPETYDLIAALYEETGNQEEATNFYKASFHSQTSGNREKSLKTRRSLKRAYIDLRDADASNVSMGRIRLLFESVDTAFKRYVRSVEVKAALFPNDPKIAILWKDLGDQYQHQGKKEEAKNCYEKAQAITNSPVREASPLVKEVGTTMSPKKERISRDLTTLIEDLGTYKTGIEGKKKAANHLKDLLTQYAEGKTTTPDAIISYVDKELAKKDNDLFKGILTQDLKKHFLKCQNLIPRKVKCM